MLGKLVKGVTDAVGLTDSGAAEASMRRASGLTKETLARLAAIDLPDIEKQKIALENPELVGLLEAESIDPTKMEDIKLDPRLRSNQIKALESLARRAEEGMTAEDKMQMEQMLGDVAAQEMAQRKSVEQEMARKGMDDSGAALIAKLGGQQAGANRARQQAMQMAAQAAQGRQSALSNLAAQSGQMQQADFGRQATVAQAQDAIAKANAMNRQQVAAQNLASRQAMENQRAALANQQQMYNKGLLQQQFQNRMAKAGAQNQATSNLAQQYAQRGAAQAAADASTMAALAGLGSAAIMAPSDIRVKEDIENGSPAIRDFLDKLEPSQYNYKEEIALEDPSMEGPQMGVMAQDLEKSDIGETFVQEDLNGVKRVDYGKMASTQLAALSDLHKRLKKLEGME
jgi:hypothetical protein